MYAFLLLLCIALLIYITIKPHSNEGFEASMMSVPQITTSVPAVVTLTNSSPVPSTVPGPLPTAPYEQLATMSPLPYQDTSLVKVNAKQITLLLQDLQAFLTYEAQHLAEQSDPTIQLPLNTAQSDFHSLQSEVDVIKRNPGIQPTVTLQHMNEIQNNLDYLRKIIRLQGSAQSDHEGFQNPPIGPPATLEQLMDFIGRIQGEILRLSASGTTDPVIQSRVSSLTKMKADVQNIVNQVQSGSMLPIEIPIVKNDIDRALPILSKPSEPLPQLIKALQLPAGLGNALPSNLQKDPNTMREIHTLLDKYADTIVHGLSASFQVNYNPPKTQEKNNRRQSTISTSGFPSASDLYNVSNAKFSPYAPDAPITDHYAMRPTEAGRGPAHFDWKKRSKEIEQQVKLRQLNPTDYGIMPPNAKVSTDFSWKGYANMICTRLQATMDPALPETCGCPPMDWKGWR